MKDIELPPGWVWDPEICAAYVYNEKKNPCCVYGKTELLEPAYEDVAKRAWEVYRGEREPD